MLEKDIQSKIKRFLEKKGAYTIKYHGGIYSQAGTPDLLVCYNGKFIGIEVKNEHGKVTPLQNDNLKAIKKAGGIAIVARSVRDVERIIKDGII